MKRLPQNQWAKEKTASWWSSLANNPADFLLFFLVLFLPSQLGRHFWPSYSFIHGLRVDYLSPTIFFTDILFLLLVLETLPIFFKKHKKIVISFGIVTTLCLIALIFGFFSQASLFWALRILESVALALLVGYFLKKKTSYLCIRLGLALSLVYTGILSLMQFINQHSAGGLWYWLGERTFSSETPAIATVSIHGNLILRSYATFAHPNLLGAYAFIIVVFLLFFKHKNSAGLQLVEKLGIIFGSSALVLSFSRASIALCVLVFLVYGLTHLVKRRHRILGLFVFCSFLMLFSYSVFGQRMLSSSVHEQSFLIREDLAKKAVIMIERNPIFGVGLQQFLPNLAFYFPASYPLSYFQPVHSFYLMLLAETGVVGFAIFLVGLILITKKIFSSSSENKLGKIVLLMIFIILSFVDHYFYTLHQGQFLAAFLFGALLL